MAHMTLEQSARYAPWVFWGAVLGSAAISGVAIGATVLRYTRRAA